jgi:hypothetical protein
MACVVSLIIESAISLRAHNGPMGESVLARVLRGSSDAGIRFDDLRVLLRRLGFAERIKGSHHIFTREGVDDILNLQPRGSLAKPYQVKQVRRVLVQHKLVGEEQ